MRAARTRVDSAGNQRYCDTHSFPKKLRSYAPETKTYIVATGNPYPIYDFEARAGDNLYTDSAVALDINTGKRVWHFQYMPNDSWDYDENGIPILQASR